MKFPFQYFLSFALTTALAPVPAIAQVAGRVLTVAGAATVERTGQQLEIVHGTELESGDLITVGDRSSLQMRFSDESVVALRANSQFKIENYRFNRSPENDRSIMGLVRGGMRTITGLIGKANPKFFGVQTRVATLGIRGTHFTLVSCNDDCTNPDGTRPENGVFGGVTDGSISVANEAGEQVFGQQDYFFVGSLTTPAQRLLAPPPVLSDRALVARARTRAGGGGTESEGRLARRAGVNISTSPQLIAQRLQPAALLALRNAIASSERPAIASALSSFTGSITVVKASSDASARPIAANTESASLSIPEIKFDFEELRDLTFYNAATLALQLQKFRTVEARPGAGAYWSYQGPREGNPTGTHLAWGDTPALALPSSGFAVYEFAGGTLPTDNFGRVGELSAGRLGMDFQSREVRALDGIAVQFAAQPNGPAATGYAIAANTAWNLVAGAQPLSGLQCSGCLGTPVAILNGRLVGATLQGYISALSFESQINGANGLARHVAAAVAVFGRQ